MGDSIWDWSQTATDNGSADSAINFSEYQNPNTVNDSARSVMKRVADLLSDLTPRKTTTGTANAYVVTSDSLGTTLRNGMTVSFIPDRSNTSAATLNVGGTGARSWRPSPGVDFSADNILVGVPVTAHYREATDEWISPGTGYYVTKLASGVSLQSITARLPQIGDAIISLDPTPGVGRIRLTEATQSILKSAYPELDSHLSSRGYPWGSTSTHFNLPPAAGYYLRFAATSASIDTGGARSAGSTQADQNKTHTHGPGTLAGSTSSDGDHTHTYQSQIISYSAAGVVGHGFFGPGGSGSVYTSSTNGSHSHTVSLTSGVSASSGGDEVRVKNVAFHLDVVASTALSAAQIAVFGFPLMWDTGTSAADPGSGRVRCNHATPASMTALYMSANDGFGASIKALLTSLPSGTLLTLSRVGAQANRIVVSVSGTPVDNTTYVTLPVIVVLSTGLFSSNDQLAFELSGLRGATGPTGPNTGMDYSWSTSTSGDPGSGNIAANAALASATSLQISKTGRNAESYGAYLSTWASSTATNKGHVRLFTLADRTEYVEADVTGVADNTTYVTVSLSNVSGGGAPSASDVMSVSFSKTGDNGSVSSAFGRTGAVIAAAGDYTAGQVTNTPAGGVAATTVQAAINELDTEKAPLDNPSFTTAAQAPMLGANATPDATNRLAVSSASSLFNHAGNGHQQKINKAAAADTASQLYQTNFSSRAEFGLTGDDNFHIKVSADGSTWKDALQIDRSTGAVTMPFTSAAGWTYVAAQATTSGSSVDFLSIPASVSEIVVYFEGMSSAGAEGPYVQLGSASGIEATGYNCSTMIQSGTGSATTGFQIYSGSAANAFYGSMRLTRENSAGTKWTAHGMCAVGTNLAITGGSKTLSAQLDRVRISAGATTFDAGSVAIKYR